MRDLLTAIAVVLIAALTAALVAPPLIDWSARRGMIESAVSQAVGVEAKTDGRIEVRLLPSPRVRVDRLRLGPAAPDAPSLDASFVKSEIALMPLLRGEVRLQDTRIGRAELRVPIDSEGGWRLPSTLLPGASRTGVFLEDLSVAQLLVTTTAPATGRTDQFYAEEVEIEAQSLAGPWRVEGMAGGAPFRLVTGEIGLGQSVPVKLSGGGDRAPRYDIDARVTLSPGRGGVVKPDATGAAKIYFGPPAQAAAAGLPIPIAVQSAFKAADRDIVLENLSVEAGEGGANLRLSGGGAIRLDEPRLLLRLEARRIDGDGFILSAAGQQLLSQAGAWEPPQLPFPLDLDVSVASVTLGQDELSDLNLRAAVQRRRVVVDKAEVVAPGQTRIALNGALDLAGGGGAHGRIAIVSGASDRFGRYLGKLGVVGPLTDFLDGRSLSAAADIVIADPVASFRGIKVNFGEATLTGNLRYTAPEASARGRLEAQVALENLDLAETPQAAGLFEAARSVDISLTMDARGLRYGGQAGAGRIAARVLSDGPELVVDTLDIADLAGADARVSGRIGPDGSGRIGGTVTAKRAAPLIDLFGRVWAGGAVRLAPAFLREGGLDLEIVAERAAGLEGSAGSLALNTTVRGTAAGGPFGADMLSAKGRVERLGLRLATDNAGRWMNKPDAPGLRRPAWFEVKGVRVSSGQFNVAADGDVGGVAIRTARPFAFGLGDDMMGSGEADLSAADVTPFLTLLGAKVGMDPPIPAQLRVTLGQERGELLVSVSGHIAEEAVEANLLARSLNDISSTASLDRLSLPWLADVFALQASANPRPGSVWPTGRFGAMQSVVSGAQVAVKAGRLDLGQGYFGEDATFNLVLNPDGLALRDLSMAFAGGRMTGSAAIARQGSLASLTGEGAIRYAALPQLLGGGSFEGQLSATLRFGASGESVAALMANFGGAGNLTIADLQVADADPGAIGRALAQVLSSSDPLASGRLQAIVAEELTRAPLRATPVSAPVTVVGGAFRMSPFTAAADSGVWQGAVSFDARALILEARGTLNAANVPSGWTGGAPYVALNWRGPVGSPAREVDASPLVNGVAAVVLQRELEKVEAFEADANERARLGQHREMDRLRRAAEDAARRAAENVARPGPTRRDRGAAGSASATAQPSDAPSPPAPVEIVRPPSQTQ